MLAFHFWPWLVGGVIFYLVGWLWYGPLFSRPWAKEVGITIGDGKGPSALNWLSSIITSFMYVLGLYLIVLFALPYGISPILASLGVGILIALPVHSGKWVWLGKGKLFLIDTGYHVVASLLLGILWELWR